MTPTQSVMDSDGIRIDDRDFAHRVHLFANLAGRDLQEVLESTAKGVLSKLVKITPPFSQAARSISQAKKAGENAVRHDLDRLFRGVELKGQRKIPLLFGNPDPEAPWYTPTKEKHPDVRGIYRTHRRLDKAGRARNYLRPYYVDRKKLAAEQKYRFSKVGYLGGGFARSAAALGVALPAFMRRHTGAAPSRHSQEFTRARLRITMENLVPYANRVAGGDMIRRVNAALRYQMNAMDRQIPHLLARRSRVL